MKFPVTCPLCVTRAATATDSGFSSTSVAVVPCGSCRDRYGVLSVTIRKSRSIELAIPVSSVVHRDGLFVFAGSDLGPETVAGRWERVAVELEPATADAIEENAAELHELESDDFFAECVKQAEPELERIHGIAR